jgi:hypothetical protein
MGSSWARIFTFELALKQAVLNPSNNLPPFLSYRFDALRVESAASGNSAIREQA